MDLDPLDFPSFRPDDATVLSTRADAESSLQQKRAVVYVTVEWAGQERQSRSVFVDFVRRIKSEHPNLGISFFVLSEYTASHAEWFTELKLPGSAKTGYGAVVWIEEGIVRGLVPYAAEAGVENLIKQTLRIWAVLNLDAKVVS